MLHLLTPKLYNALPLPVGTDFVTVIIDTHIGQVGKHLCLMHNVRLVSEHLEMLD